VSRDVFLLRQIGAPLRKHAAGTSFVEAGRNGECPFRSRAERRISCRGSRKPGSTWNRESGNGSPGTGTARSGRRFLSTPNSSSAASARRRTSWKKRCTPLRTVKGAASPCARRGRPGWYGLSSNTSCTPSRTSSSCTTSAPCSAMNGPRPGGSASSTRTESPGMVHPVPVPRDPDAAF